jgi:FkbM family methyltransferase
MLLALRHRLVLAAKKCLFSGRGEPYRIGEKTLRFVPGTRPVRLRYQTAENTVNRYDAMQLAWILENLTEGDVAIDVGANCGQCTIVMADRCGVSGSVIAFEPNPHARDILERNFALNPSVKRATIESSACSDMVGGEVKLYYNGNTSNSALVDLSKRNQTSQEPESFQVPVTTLDSYIAQQNLQDIRFVKIDTEGAEIRILRGARDVLASGAVILCELHPYAWPQFGNSLQELKDLLAGYGRRMRYLDRDAEVGNDATYGIVALEPR